VTHFENCPQCKSGPSIMFAENGFRVECEHLNFARYHKKGFDPNIALVEIAKEWNEAVIKLVIPPERPKATLTPNVTKTSDNCLVIGDDIQGYQFVERESKIDKMKQKWYAFGQSSITDEMLIRFIDRHDIELDGDTPWEVLNNLAKDWRELRIRMTAAG
jgi:hypothetical protein